nr:hypothetical protein [Salella cibi]
MPQHSTELQESISMAPEPSDSFTNLPRDQWRDVFFSLSEDVREHLITDLSRSELVTFINQLDPDKVTDVLGYTDEGAREALLTTLDSERREKINFLLSFDPESAAGVMSLDYVTVDERRDFQGVIERVRQFEERERGRFRRFSLLRMGNYVASSLEERCPWPTPRLRRSAISSRRPRMSGTTAMTKRFLRCSSKTANVQ